MPQRSTAAVLAGALLLAAVALGASCATARSASAVLPEDPASIVPLPPPDTGAVAQAYLSGSLSAMRAGQPRQAAAFLAAILRSDHLTERGRANVYWLSAEAQRVIGNESALDDALGGFLVAAEVLPPDDDLRQREVEARSTLLAKKVKSRALFGKSPEAAIPVEDTRDAPGVVAELGCVEDAVSTMPSADARKLEERRLICSESGDSLVLWFDVTQAR